MSGLAQFLGMGGYAQYVWPAFGLTAVVLVWNAIGPLRREARLKRSLAARPARNAP